MSSSFLRLAEECLRARNGRTHDKSPDELLAEAMTRSDFPNLLANSQGKTLRKAYEEAPVSYPTWCAVTAVADFKNVDRVQVSEADDLLAVPELGEYRDSSLGDEKVSYRVQTYGRIYSISRQALLNDDLGAIEKQPRRMGLAAARAVNAFAAAFLTENAPWIDNTPLFASEHRNLATGSGSVLSSEGLAEGFRALRSQQGPKGKPLNIVPRFLIVPAALEMTALQLVSSVAAVENQKSSGVVNPFYGRLQVVVEPLLDAVSASAWYLAADPAQIDTVEIAFLQGEQPTLLQRERFETDSLDFKVRLDFGGAALDYRGLYKAAGA